MGKATGDQEGDKVKTGDTASGKAVPTKTGTVVKIKPDGTRVVRTAVGTLKKMNKPSKPTDRPNQH